VGLLALRAHCSACEVGAACGKRVSPAPACTAEMAQPLCHGSMVAEIASLSRSFGRTPAPKLAWQAGAGAEARSTRSTKRALSAHREFHETSARGHKNIGNGGTPGHKNIGNGAHQVAAGQV